jgi:hypothetical protein
MKNFILLLFHQVISILPLFLAAIKNHTNPSKYGMNNAYLLSVVWNEPPSV